MKDILIAPTLIPLVAQVVPVQSEWERLGITGLSIMVTIFIWRYFTNLQEARDKVSIAERDRLLKEANEKTEQIIQLLKEQLVEQKTVSHTVIENTPYHPVPVKTVLPSDE